MHYHVSDGIHSEIDEATGHLCLYWGESKFRQTLASAVNDCIESLAPYLLEDYGDAAVQRRDIQLLRQGVDLGDPGLEAALRRYLDPTDERFNQLEYRGLAFVGFDCDRYPSTPNSMTSEGLEAGIAELVPNWSRTFAPRFRRQG